MRIWDYKLTILLALLVCAVFSNRLAPDVQSITPLQGEPAVRDNFYDVAVAGERAWIVGYYGTILQSRDRGLSWELQPSGTREALFRVQFIGGDKGWASGSYGTLLHTRDGGKSWQQQKTTVEEHIFGLHFINERQGWVVGSRGTVLATGDGGQTWENRSIADDVILNDVRFIDGKQGWMIGEFGRIYSSKDGGRTWVKQASPIEVPLVSGESRNLFRIVLSGGKAAKAFGLDGVILSAADGAQWRVSSGAPPAADGAQRYHLFAAASVNDRIWAVGERGTVLVSSIHSDEWKSAALKPPPVTLNGIAFGGNLGLIVGNRGVIFRSDNAGEEWKQIRLASNRPADAAGWTP